jgi:dCMP deaminase
LESFIEVDDHISFSKAADRRLKVVKTFVNSEASVDAFKAQLQKFHFENKELVRPNWDTYFLRLAEVVATRSNCMKRGVGAVIVSDFRIVSTGYNGTPFGCKNCNEGGC